MMSETYSSMKELDSQLEDQTYELERTKKKYKYYKEKYSHLLKNR